MAAEKATSSADERTTGRRQVDLYEYTRTPRYRKEPEFLAGWEAQDHLPRIRRQPVTTFSS